MHLRKLVLACGFASFALSNYASALGLGEVKLKSTLNQPLSAEVQLLDTKGLSPEQIIVGLASSAEFERNGLDFVHFYTEFKFEVALDGPTGPVVRITSRNPVREPYLNFLVEAKWTSGRLLREYTLLMDLPTYDDAASQAVQAAKKTPASKPTPAPVAEKKAEVATPVTQSPANTAEEPEAKPEIIAEQDQPSKKSSGGSGTYGPVGDKDTLWEIALAVRPDTSVGVHQTMLALQRLNPEAFIRGNINLLKKGQVLRVPDANEISSVSQSEAVRQFNAQTAEWSGGSVSSSDSSLGAQLDASRRSSTERAKSEAVTGRVKLEAPTSKQKSTDGQGSGANKGSGKALESELATTMEELERAKSEKTELSSRVHDLEEQVKTMQRLVDVSNEKLRALQLNSGKQPEKSAANDKKAAEAKSATPVETPATPASSVAAAQSSVAAAQPKKPIAKPAPVVVPEKSIVDQLFDNILWVGLGAAGLLGAGGLLLARRRKEQAEAEHRRSMAEDDQSNEPGFDGFNQSFDEPAEAASEVDEMALFEEEDTTAVAETGDVVGEADIYIAYGKFDQAEEMLVNGLAKDPDSTDIRLKLLEVYSQTKNAVQFDKHYGLLLPLASGLVLNRANELRANIPGMPEFNSVAVQPEESFDSAEDFQLADFDLETPEPQVAQVNEESTPDSEEDFAFDLDLDLDDVDGLGDEPASPESIQSAADLEDDFALDFELEDLESTQKLDQAPAEDLSDISLALDSLEEDTLPHDIEMSKHEEDEFSFDFNELDNEPSSLAQEANSIKSAEFNEGDTLADDFNLEMDVDSVDLAALDNEMASLDAELELLDENTSINEFSSEASSEFSNVENDEFSLEDFDNELESLDSSFDSKEELSLVDEELPSSSEPEFAWEDDELEFESAESESGFEFEPEESEVEQSLASEELEVEEDFAIDDLALDEELSVEDDDSFEFDAPVELADEASLEEMDQELSTAENSFDFDENAFAELDSELEGETSLELEDDSSWDSSSELSLEDESLDLESSPVALESAEPETVQEEFATGSVGEELSDDDVFEQALSDFSAESLAMEDSSEMSEDDMDAELDFMADADEAATKLDLARAYMDMGDNDGARDILAEVAHEGNDQQRQEAADLLSRIDA